MMFDLCMGKIDSECQDHILIHHLLTSFYLVLKAENRIEKLSFDKFQAHCFRLPLLTQLWSSLNPQKTPVLTKESYYPDLELLYLTKVLKFKTNIVSPAELIYQIICTFSHVHKSSDRERFAVEHLLESAIHYSYIALECVRI